MFRKLCFGLMLAVLSCCNASSVSDAIDLAEGIPRKDIDASTLGTNAFVNDTRFGSPNAQFLEIRDTLRLGFVRVLFNWSDAVQPRPGANPNFSFYDDILAAVPSGLDVLVVVTGVPSWMSNSGNWKENNPRTTFVDNWALKVFDRYSGNPRIIGWQIWNEPNMTANPDNTVIDVALKPGNYVEMLGRAYSRSKSINSSKLVLNAATTAINQNFPETLDYNRAMRDAGAENFTDRWAIHYYGKQFENVERGSGVKDFLNGLSRAIWVTESGAQGVSEQLAYGEQVWPFLMDKIDRLERIYQYQFAEPTPSDVTYGMKNLDPNFPVSDLYVWLRDRP